MKIILKFLLGGLFVIFVVGIILHAANGNHDHIVFTPGLVDDTAFLNDAHLSELPTGEQAYQSIIKANYVPALHDTNFREFHADINTQWVAFAESEKKVLNLLHDLDKNHSLLHNTPWIQQYSHALGELGKPVEMLKSYPISPVKAQSAVKQYNLAGEKAFSVNYALDAGITMRSSVNFNDALKHIKSMVTALASARSYLYALDRNSRQHQILRKPAKQAETVYLRAGDHPDFFLMTTKSAYDLGLKRVKESMATGEAFDLTDDEILQLRDAMVEMPVDTPAHVLSRYQKRVYVVIADGDHKGERGYVPEEWVHHFSEYDDD